MTPHPAILLAMSLLAGGMSDGRAEEPQGTEATGFRLPTAAGSFPATLSETAVFADLATLTPDPAFVPYELNVPFWSDGAAKRRWVAVPQGLRIGFSADEPWTFPAGTVFLKHFERATDTGPRRLETRLLIGDGQGGVRGASYRWRDDGSDADLVQAPILDERPAGSSNGSPARRWYFPGPDDCRKCHLPAAGGVLGVNTRQLNRDIKTGGTANQLLRWGRAGLLAGLAESDMARLPKLPRLDDPHATPEQRARSFLDANCAHCHRPGGAVADFDARYSTPLTKQNLIDARVRIDFGIDRARFVAPNDPWRSMVLVRAGMLGQSGMPPLAHEAIDPQGVKVLRDWIESLAGPPTLAPPVIERDGDRGGPIRVAIRHDDPEAVLRYTLDGSAPAKSSPVYAGPIELNGPATVRARAERPGWNRSIAVHATFVPGE